MLIGILAFGEAVGGPVGDAVGDAVDRIVYVIDVDLDRLLL